MFKTSTGGFRATTIAAAAAAVFACAGALAQEASRFPITPEERKVADEVAQAGVPLSALAPTAPDSYIVKRGDTLWALSSMYLTSPWRWPELWGMNKQQVRNPHLIYPGQELLLVKGDGRARLQFGGDTGGSGAENGPGKLEPRIRDVGTGRVAISAVPNNLIEPFLSQPLVLEPGALNDAARFIATQEGRVFVGRGDEAYARGVQNDSVINYNVFRPLRPLYDPEDKERKHPIAYEAFYLGTANLMKGGEVSTFNIVQSKQEIGIGDRLLPVERQPIMAYLPHRPANPIEARVISIYAGVTFAGGNNIVTLNRGSNDGVDVGAVLQLMRSGQTVRDRTSAKREFVKLPDEPSGLLFIFRAFPTISYGLIVRGTNTVEIGDRATSPDGAVELDIKTEDQTPGREQRPVAAQ